MASGELTGGTEKEITEIRLEYQETPLHQDNDIPFETAYCLMPIGKQPDEYDGPQRYCRRRAVKRDGFQNEYTEEAYGPFCPFHGGDATGSPETLKPYTAGITHGLRAEDEHLRMDFTDAEQTLYDSIMEQWPEIYGWPDEDEDPARYLILRKVATNIVRSHRAEDYIDEEGEVRISDKYNDDGVVVEPNGVHEENPISREYRLLVDEIISMLKELGVTPKERAKMDKVEAETGAAETVAGIAGQALDSDDAEYDPDQFSEE